MFEKRRREFITLLGGAAVTWPLAARAQPQRGLSTRISPSPEGNRICRGRERGDRLSMGDGQMDRLPGLAAKLARRPVAVLIAIGDAAALAAQAATTTIPIVFQVGRDHFENHGARLAIWQ
jgi:putative ABC transport system substrate-binding protein